MLIDITIKNYLSFKDETTFSLLTWTNKKKEELEGNFFSVNKKTKLLKTAIVYWPNASGKTNLLKAINFIKNFIIYSHTSIANTPIYWFTNAPLQPYKLNTETKDKPSEFEINFFIEEIQYRYKFSVNNKEVLSEDLYAYKSQKERILYTRSKEHWIIIKDFNDNNSKDRVKENSLALSVFANENSEEAKKIQKFFLDIHIFFRNTIWHIDTFNMLKNEPEIFKPFLLNLLKKADLWIEDVNYNTQKISLEQLPPEVRDHFIHMQPINNNQDLEKIDWWFSHSIYDNAWIATNKIDFKEDSESEWTMRVFDLAWSIYNVIRQWKILFVDEIDDSLHPLLLEKIVESLHVENKKYQFIFTTHNTHLMNIQTLFRRDQIWFVEKLQYWESKLYWLLEFNDKTRKDIILEKNYYKGRYWALPKFIWDNLFLDQETSNGKI